MERGCDQTHWPADQEKRPDTFLYSGANRTLKLAVGVIVRPTRRADAQPLAVRVFMRSIRCPDAGRVLFR